MSNRTSFVLSILAAGTLSALFAAPVGAADPGADPAPGTAAGAADPAPAAADPAPLIGPAAPGGLTADVVAARALATSPGLRGDLEETIARHHAVQQARAGFVPRLSGALSYARSSARSSCRR